MDRRTFIQGAALAGAGVAAGVALDRSVLRPSTPPTPVTVQPDAPAAIDPELTKRYSELLADLRDTFSYLDIPEDTFGRYLADLARYDLKPRRYDARNTFLLSTDFFVNDADESKPLTYVQLYDPYRSPCWNPCTTRS